jgi:hypothetical protein
MNTLRRVLFRLQHWLRISYLEGNRINKWNKQQLIKLMRESRVGPNQGELD